jgi:hypothetical protein
VNVLATALADLRGIARVRSERGSRKIKMLAEAAIAAEEEMAS